MGLLEKIRQSVELQGEHFEYGTVQELNNLLKTSEMPAVFMNLLVDSEQIQVSGQTVEQASVMLFFINLTSWDLYAPENEVIIEECKQRADRWLNGVKKNNVLKKINNARYKRVYLQFDGQYTGIGVNVILRENIGSSNCGYNPIFPNPAEWQPQPDWWDIVKIFETNPNPNKRQIILIADTDLVTTINSSIGNSTAQYLTSDGVFYSGGSTFTHTWDLSKDKICNMGYKTRWIMVFSENRNISCSYSAYNAIYAYIGNNSNITTLQQYIAASGLSSEALQAIKYSLDVTFSTGALLNEGFRNCYSFQYFKFPNNLITVSSNAFFQASSWSAKNGRIVLPEALSSMGVNALNATNGIYWLIIEGATALTTSSISIATLNTLTFKKSVPSAVNNSITTYRSLLSFNIPEGWTYPANLTLSASTRWSYSNMLKFLNNLGLNTGSTITITIGNSNKNKLLSTPEGQQAIAYATSQNITIA